MNETETRATYIDPALRAAGWGVVAGSRIRMEFPITKGRLIGNGQRQKPDKADYVLQYKSGMDMASKIFGERYLRIFYEDLITNPQSEIKKICDAVAIDFEPAMMEFYKSSDQVAASGESWKENLNKNFMSNCFHHLFSGAL